MLRTISAFFLCGTMATAWWAYSESYTTRQQSDLHRSILRDIGALNQDIQILEAEWSYLNNPGRLRKLVEMNAGRLKISPRSPDQFVKINNIAYPIYRPAPSVQEAIDTCILGLSESIPGRPPRNPKPIKDTCIAQVDKDRPKF